MTRLTTLIFVFVSLEMYAQVFISSTVPVTDLVCPGASTRYEVKFSSGDYKACNITWSITEGQGVFYNNLKTGPYVHISWSDQNPNHVIVKAAVGYVDSDQSCPAAYATSATFTHILRSVRSQSLQIGDASVEVPYCPSSQPTVSLTVGRMFIKNTGLPGQPPQTEVERYEWILPAGWRIKNTHQTGTYYTPLHAIQIEPANPGGICSGNGSVKVRGIAGVLACVGLAPSLSNQATITLTRAPIISLAAPPEYGGPTCDAEAPVSFVATPFSCSTQYQWSYPSGWSGPTTTSTNYVSLTPSGNPSDGTGGGNDGQIKVSANLGACVVKAAYQLTYRNPTLVISGLGPVCTSGRTFSVNAPIHSTTSWNAQPSTFLVSGAGTGSSALLRATSPAAGGNTTLTFSVQNAECAISAVLNKSIWIGPPKVLDYQGNETSITLEGNTSFARSPFPCIERSGTAYNYTYYAELSDYTKIKGMTGTVTWGGSFGGSSPAYHPWGIFFSPNPLTGSHYGSGYISATGSNACGSSQVAARGYGPCYQYAMYPNPANTEISFVYDGEDQNQSIMNETATRGQEFDVMLFNSKNIEVRRGKARNGKLKLDTSDLPRGVYIAHIISPDSREILTVTVE